MDKLKNFRSFSEQTIYFLLTPKKIHIYGYTETVITQKST